MFERYTEHARRVIFFSRYEASEFGSPYIEPEHLLLGLLRERSSVYFLLPTTLTLDGLRRELQTTLRVRAKFSTSVDIPLSHEGKRILAYGAEESERLRDEYIGPQHLLLGMLREETLASAILRKHGVQLDQLREQLAQGARISASPPEGQDVIVELRRKFRPLVLDLTPEIEPAARYLLRPPTQIPE